MNTTPPSAPPIPTPISTSTHTVPNVAASVYVPPSAPLPQQYQTQAPVSYEVLLDEQPLDAGGEYDSISVGIPGSTIPSQPIAVPSDDDIKKRRELIERLKAYEKLFKHKLDGFNFTNLESLSMPQLIALKKDVNHTVNMTNGAATLRTMSKLTFDVMGSFVDAPGLGTALDMNPEYVDSVHEAGIEYSRSIITDPLVRIGFIAVTTAYTLHSNKRKVSEICNPFLANTVEPELKKRYNDL